METSTRYNGVDIKNLYRSTRELKITDRAIQITLTGEGWDGREFYTKTADGFYLESSIAKAKKFIDAAIAIGCEVVNSKLVMSEEQYDVCVLSDLNTATAEGLIAKVQVFTVATAQRVEDRAVRKEGARIGLAAAAAERAAKVGF